MPHVGSERVKNFPKGTLARVIDVSVGGYPVTVEVAGFIDYSLGYFYLEWDSRNCELVTNTRWK